VDDPTHEVRYRIRTPLMTPAPTSFEPECRAAIDGVRAALLELYSNVGANPSGPQEVSRRFGVNKTLAWNVSKVMTGDDPMASIPNLPGSSAFQSLFAAIERGGGDPQVVERARAAVRALDATVARHVGDRSTLDLVVDGISPASGDFLEHSRKLAFRGNSGLLGVQAKVRLMTVLMAPNAKDESRVDIAIVRGYLGLRRLRTDVRWPIFQMRAWGSEEGMTRADQWEPLESIERGSAGSPIMRRFSSVSERDLEVQHAPTGSNYLLAPGPIGNSGAVDCFVGDCARAAASRYRTKKDSTGEFGATISAPTERLVFDLIVDERLEFVLRPEVRAFMGIFMDSTEDTMAGSGMALAVPRVVTALPGRPPAVTTPGVPQYSAIVKLVNERMGWAGDNFRGCRFALSHPPLGSTILLRFTLPEAPRSAR